jgi:hypothetical protein
MATVVLLAVAFILRGNALSHSLRKEAQQVRQEADASASLSKPVYCLEVLGKYRGFPPRSTSEARPANYRLPGFVAVTPRIEKALEMNAELFLSLGKATADSDDSDHLPLSGRTRASLSGDFDVIEVQGLLAIAARYWAQKGQPDKALQHIEMLLRLSEAVCAETDGPLEWRLKMLAGEVPATEVLECVLLESNPSRGAAAEFATKLASHRERRPPFTRSVQQEYCLMLLVLSRAIREYRVFAARPFPTYDAVELSEGGVPNRPYLPEEEVSESGWGKWLWWRSTGAASERSKLRAFFVSYGKIAEAPLSGDLGAILASWDSQDVLGAMITNLSRYDFYARNEFRAQTCLTLAQVAVACRLYREARGEYPSSLADLSPGYLAKPLLDPVNGAPLKYAHKGRGVIIWSVGLDRRDDAGTKTRKWPDGDITFELE